MKRGILALSVCIVAAAAFMAGRWTAPAPVLAPPAAKVSDAPSGARGLELARIRRVAVRVGSDDVVSGARPDVEASLRNRLSSAGFTVVGEGEPNDAVVQVRIEGFHFSAFDEYGAGSEIHLVALHPVELDGAVRLIPHDIWQADSMRLTRKDRLDAEALALTEELLQHLLSAAERARSMR